VTDKSLNALDRKIAAALSKVRQDSTTVRRKSEPGPKLETPSGKDRRVSRDSIQPQSEPIISATSQEVEPPKRKRGRPRLSSPRRAAKDAIKEEKALIGLKSLAVANQPRDSHGRFGKKGYYSRQRSGSVHAVLTRAQRAIERSKVKSWLERRAEENERAGGSDISSRKRSAVDLEDSGRPNKIARVYDEPPLATSHVFAIRRPATGFKGMGLLQAPNPMSFARRTWIPVVDASDSSKSGESDLSLDGTEDETDLPVTPEDKLSAANVVLDDSENIQDSVLLPLRNILPVTNEKLRPTPSPFRQIAPPPAGALTFKPSPVNFARRRWGLHADPDKIALSNLKDNSDTIVTLDGGRVRGRSSGLTSGTMLAPVRTPWSNDGDSFTSSEEVNDIVSSIDFCMV
jgi:histone-lysine N-methyltransferase SUV420H